MYRLRIKSIYAGILAVAFSFLLSAPLTARAAAAVYTNPENGYIVIVEDDADLLTAAEEQELAEQMEAITAYGGAAFKSIDQNRTSAANFAESYYAEVFGRNSGILFLIDMDNRKIWIYCDGAVYRTITENYADTITDNVYKYASDGDYYLCASKAFGQAQTLLQGQRIAQPMKYICNALLAVICALLLNFGFVNFFSKAGRTNDRELLAHVEKRCNYTTPRESFLRRTKTYNPPSSGGGSSGGGGGGSSGGGGGHSF